MVFKPWPISFPMCLLCIMFPDTIPMISYSLPGMFSVFVNSTLSASDIQKAAARTPLTPALVSAYVI